MRGHVHQPGWHDGRAVHDAVSGQRRGFSVVAAGEVVAGFGGGAIIAPLIGGALADHVGRRSTLLAATLITAAIMVALASSVPPHS